MAFILIASIINRYNWSIQSVDTISRSLLRDFDMKRLTLALAAVSLALLSAACGQSGPLYLPGNPSQIQNVPNTPADADKEDADEEDGEQQQEDSDAPQG